MDRRSFIGSIVGTLGSGAFFRAEATPVISRLSDSVRFARLASLFGLEPNELRQCRLCVINTSGDSWWAPPLMDVKIESHKRLLIAAPVHVTQRIDYRGIGIFNHEKQFLGTADFSHVVTADVGDQLNITYTISR